MISYLNIWKVAFKGFLAIFDLCMYNTCFVQRLRFQAYRPFSWDYMTSFSQERARHFFIWFQGFSNSICKRTFSITIKEKQAIKQFHLFINSLRQKNKGHYLPAEKSNNKEILKAKTKEHCPPAEISNNKDVLNKTKQNKTK